MSINNIDTRQVIEYKKEIQKNPADAKFTAKIEGDWLFTEGGPQFRSVVTVKDGTYTMEASHPNFAGPASRPGPMAFGLFWFAACYSSTFVTEASMQQSQTHLSQDPGRGRPRLHRTVRSRQAAPRECIPRLYGREGRCNRSPAQGSQGIFPDALHGHVHHPACHRIKGRSQKNLISSTRQVVQQ